METIDKKQFAQFVADIKTKIREAQYEALRAVNRHLIDLYWSIGQSIVEKQEAFGWGKSVVEKLSLELQAEFKGIQGFSTPNLWFMRRFYLEYNQSANLYPLVREISWAKHLVIMNKCKDKLQREFYIRMTKRENDKKWIPDNDLQFEVEYDFMPPGLFSRFIVSRYEDIAGENRDLVWRDEVFFHWDNATANVSLPSRAGKKAIVFKVQGKDIEERKLLLTSLLRDLKKLHAETPGIAAEERIPCICPKCSESTEKQFFEHSVLKDFLEEGDDAIQCQKSRKMVSVNALLGNVFSTGKAPAPEAPDKTFIRDLLKKDKLEEALALLEEFAPDECVMLHASLARIRRSSNVNTSSPETEATIRQQTIRAVLDWLNEQQL